MKGKPKIIMGIVSTLVMLTVCQQASAGPCSNQSSQTSLYLARSACACAIHDKETIEKKTYRKDQLEYCKSHLSESELKQSYEQQVAEDEKRGGGPK